MTLLELIETVIGVSNIHKKGSDYNFNCVFCPERVDKRDTKHRLGININTGKGNCFRCEKKFRDPNSPSNAKRYWFRELCRVFNKNYTYTHEDSDADSNTDGLGRTDGSTRKGRLGQTRKKNKESQRYYIPSEYEPLWKNCNDRISKDAHFYLRKRGITKEQIRKHRIGFCAVGKYAWRIVFPVSSPKGKLRGFVARDFGGQTDFRYLNSEGTKELYNLSPAKRRNRICVLGEGIFDVLAFERAAIPNTDAVAGLGKTLTKRQYRILSKYEVVVIWPDPDMPGVEGCIKRAAKLQRKGCRVEVVIPDRDDTENDDLGSLRESEIKHRWIGRKPYTAGIGELMRIRVASGIPKKTKGKLKFPISRTI